MNIERIYKGIIVFTIYMTMALFLNSSCWVWYEIGTSKYINKQIDKKRLEEIINYGELKNEFFEKPQDYLKENNNEK